MGVIESIEARLDMIAPTAHDLHSRVAVADGVHANEDDYSQTVSFAQIAEGPGSRGVLAGDRPGRRLCAGSPSRCRQGCERHAHFDQLKPSVNNSVTGLSSSILGLPIQFPQALGIRPGRVALSHARI